MAPLAPPWVRYCLVLVRISLQSFKLLQYNFSESRGSSECLAGRSEEDNLSRELVLISSPHYKHQEFLSGYSMYFN